MTGPNISPSRSRRRETRRVPVGRIFIGGGAPISVQTMWKRPLKRDTIRQTLEEIQALEKLGCELLRFSVPDMEAAELLGRIASRIELPLVADIHFDHRLALRCLDFPVAKIRINPGTIGGSGKVQELVRKASDRAAAIRIGVNAGSLPPALRNEKDLAQALVKAAEEELSLLEKLGFGRVVVSLKAADVDSTVRANLLFSEKFDYPLHVGLTEAGPLVQGTVRNAVALSRLLASGVGDTIRVSLSDSPQNELLAGRAILQSTGVRNMGIELISCPTCGRTAFDVTGFLHQVQEYLQGVSKQATIAIMGCPVNGPGEARRADLGITGTGRRVLFFKKGRIIRRENADDAIEAFKEELDKL